MQALRTDPDRDTVQALSFLAGHAAMTGSSDADQLTSEALQLGQELDVDGGLLAQLFTARGIYLSVANRSAEAIAHAEYSARIAERAGDTPELGRALLNLTDALLGVDPHAAVEAARASCEHSRRIGARFMLAAGVSNLSTALLFTGDWDAADAALVAAAEGDGLGEDELLLAYRGMLAALRGDVTSAQLWAALPRLRATEDPQYRSVCETLDMLIAAAQADPAGTLAHARAVLATAEAALGVRHESVIWSWPAAARAARQLGDLAAVEELLARLEAHPPGHLPPLLRAECHLARARQAGDARGPAADELFDQAIAALRRVASPYHLAHGLLDHAEYLVATGKPDRADPAVAEARAIADNLSARPLLARAESIASRIGTASSGSGTKLTTTLHAPFAGSGAAAVASDDAAAVTAASSPLIPG